MTQTPIYDELVELKQSNEDEFHARCRELIEQHIRSLPEERQQAARQMQWRLDHELSKFKDPIARMNKMVELFWVQVGKFKDSLNGDILPASEKVEGSKVVELFKK